ncbi:ATP-binding protein [Clostridium sp. PL3]|uniref:ATP-binding protein n=1 Tax=Clostridium thailandense TaxID=2794346 RepID=A0A949WQZ3_9CLOT|nr:ATP-binding protein [Clostridium thailandense]MBV7273380.1 ATP-binding protein [Clostridium thailandense]
MNVLNKGLDIELLNYEIRIKGIVDIKSIGSIIKICHVEVKAKYESKSVSNKFSTCLYELVANAVEHGNKNGIAKSVRINIDFSKDKITFRVEDEGKGFDWKSYNYNFEESDEYRGRGLKIVKYYCNELTFNDRGNIISACIYT